jgi:hypothetical protein
MGSEVIEVAGIWEQGWNTPIAESVQWEMMLREFDVDALSMCPVSGIAAPWGAAPWIQEYASMDEILASKRDMTWVFVTESGESDLREFDHPESALYIFGRASESVTPPDGALTVRIAPGKGCLWAHQACAVVLYDRHLKQ